MEKEKQEEPGAKERRSGEDRRKGDRRARNNEEPAGVLTTRSSERRVRTRRAEDRKTSKPS